MKEMRGKKEGKKEGRRDGVVAEWKFLAYKTGMDFFKKSIWQQSCEKRLYIYFSYMNN